MTLRQYIILMSFGSILCFLIWGGVVCMIDPTEAGIFGFVFFYLSLFLALVGSLSVLGLLLRRRFGKEEAVFRIVTTSFRQAMMLGFLVIGSLFLQGKNLLSWLNMLFLVLAVVIMEFFFISYNKYRQR